MQMKTEQALKEEEIIQLPFFIVCISWTFRFGLRLYRSANE
jgi:hypothetical protein